MTKTGWIILVVIPLLVVSVAVVGRETIYDYFASDKPTPIATSTPTITTLPYGEVVLRVGEKATFPNNSIRLLRVFDESRCPQGVTCIWAGTVKTEIESVTGMGTSTEIIELGKFVTTEAEKITFVSASPYPKQGSTISQNDYQIVFEVIQRSQSEINPSQPSTGACYVGGCSAEVCSDQPNVASNCIYRPEFACYKKSKCERQSNGLCGWTQNEELKMCLANPPRE
jgi:hypothetical protein